MIEQRTTYGAFLFPDFPVRPESVYFVSCPKQGLEMEAVVLHRVGFLGFTVVSMQSHFDTSRFETNRSHFDTHVKSFQYTSKVNSIQT